MAEKISINADTIAHAKSVSIVDVIQAHGINLVSDGKNYYHWDQHNSFVVNAKKNSFFWNSRGISGSSIDFMLKVAGAKDFRSAVAALNSADYKIADFTPEKQEPFSYQIENSSSFSRAHDYLTIHRGINPTLVDSLHKRGFIQQDVHGNVVFVWARDGQRVGASLQGTYIDHKRFGKRGAFKQIASNSENDFGFNFAIGQPKQLMVFEAPIDALSYVSLHPEVKDTLFFSMDGLKDQSAIRAISYFYSRTGEIPDRVGFGVDNDPAGQQFFDKMLAHHSLTNQDTGMTLPYVLVSPGQRTIPEKKLQIIQAAAQKHGVDWKDIAALEKVETNFSITGQSANGIGYKGTFTSGDPKVVESKDQYLNRVESTAVAIKKHSSADGIDYPALLRTVAPNLDPTLEQQLISKIKGYTTQYKKNGPKPVKYPIKDWNDELKQVQAAGGFTERLVDRIYSNKDKQKAVEIERLTNSDGSSRLKAVSSFDRSVGFFEAESPQEMAFLLKTYGYNAVDKEDEAKYRSQAPTQNHPLIRSVEKAAESVSKNVARDAIAPTL